MWQSSAWPTHGYLYASALVEPGQIKKVSRLLREIGDDLARRGATPDEFAQVHQPKLAVLEDELRHNGYWLHYVLPYLADEPWTARLPLSRTADYRSITCEELNEFARRYLRPAQATTLIVTSS
jgi:predicted Zn-dependent peptidase